MMLKNSAKWVGIAVGIMLLGGVGGVLFDRSVLPWLATQKGLSRIGFLERASDNVTIINKTEQITVREDDSIENIVSQPATAVVTLITRMTTATAAPSVAAQGSISLGVLLTNDGVIATYRSEGIAKPADQAFSAVLFDGSVHEARFIGWDSLSHIAFFRIDVSDAPAIALADSDGARIGKKLIVVAPGDQARQNRFLTGSLDGFDATFNLSGKTVSSTEKWEGVFRMNSVVSSDFVGSPALQYNGEMLGLIGSLAIDNTQETFIVPSKAIRQSLDFILSAESASGRPSFGAYYLPITQSLSILQGLPKEQGAWIYSPSGRTGLALIAGSPAEKSGLRANDIILSVAGESITLGNPLPAALMKFKRGDAFEMNILRDGSEQTVFVTL